MLIYCQIKIFSLIHFLEFNSEIAMFSYMQNSSTEDKSEMRSRLQFKAHFRYSLWVAAAVNYTESFPFLAICYHQQRPPRVNNAEKGKWKYVSHILNSPPSAHS